MSEQRKVPVRGPGELALEAIVKRLADAARILPALTAKNGLAERQRLVRVVEAGEMAVPAFEVAPRRMDAEVWRALDHARTLAGASPLKDAYLARIDELELELSLLEALGDVRRVRRLALRRYGAGTMTVPAAGGQVRLSEAADAILETIQPSLEPALLPADSPDPEEPSLTRFMLRMAAAIGLETTIRVEPRLAAAAATGDRTVYIANRRFGVREGMRLAVHEVLGHLVAAANARSQPTRLLEIGTAGAFADQEGMCLWLEEESGLMDGSRLRTLAARVITTDWMHAGAAFGEAARLLVKDHGFSAHDAVVLAERAYRGGGVARDAGYLAGWLRVRRAIRTGDASIDELRMGRVCIEVLPLLREQCAAGRLYESPFRPSLAESLGRTEWGTSSPTSPPNVATSLTKLELT